MIDIHALSGAYAVDALSDDERHDFEAHLAECPDCQAEVASLREAASLLPFTAALAPSEGLREQVLGQIRTVRPLPPLTHRDEDDDVAGDAKVVRLSRRRRFQAGVLGLAAAVVIAVAAITVIPQVTGGDDQLTATEQVLLADDVEHFEVDPATIGGAQARFSVSRENDAAVLTTHDMAGPGDGNVYQLWLQEPDGSMVSAGLMPEGSDNKVVLDGNAGDAVGAGITVEPEGGSDEPTMPPVALVEFESA